MAFGRRSRQQDSGKVEIVASDRGLLVQGPSSLVTAFVKRVTAVATESHGRVTLLAADGLAVAGGLASEVKTHGEYFEFSPQALQYLREHGAIPSTDGHFHPFVKSNGGQFVGNLKWKPVDLRPEQALAFQTATSQLALRAAVKELAAAIERVEGKVDKLISLTRAERLGSAMGDRGTLQSLAEHTRERGRISATDWSTVGSLGALIPRDIAALRAYVMDQAKDLESKAFARTRSSELKNLTDDLLRESLDLLLVVEQNYMLWQEIRVAQVATNEPDALADAISDVRTQLEAITLEDQWMIDAVRTAASKLLRPTGWEGFLPIERSRLRKRAVELDEIIGEFSEQRHLDCDQLASEYPTIRGSLRKAEEIAKETAGNLGTRAKGGLGRLRDRGESPEADT